ncbi:hypothetical protein L2E82_12795 [Cichorium intybus]|uniref:Uncharacterized protein n=1 Tax=Cichorium intybus TaxID=13427 RepID=A0ACB9GI35_CICIN|nr:hypothetical protein L2E82_12795 [Cichorium intybus]
MFSSPPSPPKVSQSSPSFLMIDHTADLLFLFPVVDCTRQPWCKRAVLKVQNFAISVRSPEASNWHGCQGQDWHDDDDAGDDDEDIGDTAIVPTSSPAAADPPDEMPPWASTLLSHIDTCLDSLRAHVDTEFGTIRTQIGALETAFKDFRHSGQHYNKRRSDSASTSQHPRSP